MKEKEENNTLAVKSSSGLCFVGYSGRLRHVCNEFVNSAHIKGNQNNAFRGF